MALLYVTNDVIGAPTGGGRVTQEELSTLKTLEAVCTFRPHGGIANPFDQDESVLNQLSGLIWHEDDGIKLAHVYAGCFSRSVANLKGMGYTVTYTVAAHDIALSKKAHEELGLPFDYPHLIHPDKWARYAEGYLKHADVVIVPGKAPLKVVRSQGRQGRVEVIPHGCDLPESPRRKEGGPFTVGYLGAIGPDKGLLTLAKAWKEHSAKPGNEGDKLLIGGKYSHHAAPLFSQSPGSVHFHGWYDSVSDFYQDIDLYVQPSNTEGFGIEVLEAMTHRLPVLCSDRAGACDLVPAAWSFPAGDFKELAAKIALARDVIGMKGSAPAWGDLWRQRAEGCTWDKIRARYVALWKSLLEGSK